MYIVYVLFICVYKVDYMELPLLKRNTGIYKLYTPVKFPARLMAYSYTGNFIVKKSSSEDENPSFRAHIFSHL